jgi:cytochrome c
VLSLLMHCLLSPTGLALGLCGLSVFFPAHAQEKLVPPSAERGLAIYQAKCGACHSADENRVGPAHAGVLGRRVGKAKDFEYSPALAQSKLVWSRANLERWLTDPEKLIAGQRMGYRMPVAQERADVVAYLATLSSPK